MTTTTIVIVAVAVLLLVALLAVAAGVLRRRKERRDVRERFGPEYERLAKEQDEDAAVDELEHREERHDQFDIRELSAERRRYFQHQWQDIQREFVDHPSVAVARGDALIQDVMRERGYPVEDFEQRAADLSVDHPAVVQHYRRGHELATRNDEAETTTEQLRDGFIHYRELFASLVGETTDERAPVAERDGSPTADATTDRQDDA